MGGLWIECEEGGAEQLEHGHYWSFLVTMGIGNDFFLNTSLRGLAAPVFGDDIADLQAEQAEQGETDDQLPGARCEIDRAAAETIYRQRDTADHDAGDCAQQYAAPVALRQAGEDGALMPQQLQRGEQQQRG